MNEASYYSMEDMDQRMARLVVDAYSIKHEYESRRGTGFGSSNIVDQLCDELPADGPPVEISPYNGIMPNLHMGFEGNAAARIAVRSVRAGDGPGAASRKVVDMTVSSIGTSSWLTVEFVWNWGSLIAKNSTHILMEAVAWPAINIQPKLRLPVKGGGHHDVEGTPIDFGKDPKLRLITVILPSENVIFDIHTRPTMILFLPPKPLALSVSKLFLW